MRLVTNGVVLPQGNCAPISFPAGDKTSSSMQTAPLIQSITPPKRSDTTTSIAEKWKQFKQIWDNYAIITNLTAQKKKYRVVDCGASINIITKTHTIGSHVTPHQTER